MIKTAWVNVLESSNVSLSMGTWDPAFPLYRLHDRNIGKAFRASSAETIEIKVDQGASGGQALDRLIIPSGHNLNGMTLDISHSDDDSFYTPAVTQWIGTEGMITKSWNPLFKRYWKFTITTPASPPELAELFLTSTYDWDREPATPAWPSEMVFNVENAATSSGKVRFLVHGEPKRKRSIHMARCGTAQRDEMAALSDGIRGALPFWLLDHNGDWIYGRLTKPMELVETAFETYSLNLDFMEVLP